MKTNERMYVDFHVLQTVPPSCVNRDDTGSPKTAVYGGATRARVSSQAWKHAVRNRFLEILPESKVGKRTKHIPELLAEAIAAQDASVDAEKLAMDTLAKMKVVNEKKKDEGKTSALFFISQAQLNALAALALAGESNDKALEKALIEGPAVDIALFGRMVASNPTLNTDAACQVAHAISTHAVHNEYDYFTAVDDCSPEDNMGAGHLGTVEYNSATLYRYATVNVCDLYSKLGADTPDAVHAFADAFIHAMPTGKQNTFANRTMPDLVYITLRTDQPANLAGAFERPIPPSEEGYAGRSARALLAYAKRVYGAFAQEPEAAYVASTLELGEDTPLMPVPALLDALKTDVAGRLNGGI